MKNLFTLLAAFVLATTLAAQTYSVAGRTTNGAEPAEPLPLAHIALLADDTTAVASTTSGNDGLFSLTVKAPGRYLLRATFIGHKTAEQRVTLSDKQPAIDLKDLAMKPDGVMLSEAQVTALSQQLTIKADTFVYHSKGFRLPPGASLATLMQQLPGLAVDKDGNLTFQGKSVSGILVNGKPFFESAQDALINMPVEAVQDVKIYEKTDEDKEFARAIDTDKQTVVDLKIKKEWMNAWNFNVEAGGGTDERFLGKLFGSNFDERRRASVYASDNNLGANQYVDENGNWQHWSNGFGEKTYRKAGAVFSYDNGKKNTEAGYLQTKGEVEVAHDTNKRNTENITENYLSPDLSHHSFARSQSRYDNRDINAFGYLRANIDTLRRINANVSYNYSETPSRARDWTSVYNEPPTAADRFTGLTGDNPAEELQRIGIYGREQRQKGFSSYHVFSGFARYTRRFAKKGRSLELSANYYGSWDEAEDDLLRRTQYFSADAPQSLRIDRDWNPKNENNHHLNARAEYMDEVKENLQWGLSYEYTHDSKETTDNYYRFAIYDYYNSMQPDLGIHPSTADSLARALDADNSHRQSTRTDDHELSAAIMRKWDKLEVVAALDAHYVMNSLEYRRKDNDHDLSRNYFYLRPTAQLDWKYLEGSRLKLVYTAQNTRPELSMLLPVSNSRDELNVSKGNANLKESWRQNANLNFNFFNKKRGDNYSLYGSANVTHRPLVGTLRINPATGAQESGYTNSDKADQNYYVSFNTEQPLDSARHWTIRAGAGFDYSRQESLTGGMAGGFSLSTVHRTNFRANMSVSWRKGIWSISLRGGTWNPTSRYTDAPQYDEYAHGYEAQLSPQVDLPFGMKISTSMHYYGLRGYLTPEMNKDQWIWNASISQSFLKDKSLTVRLEGVDLLHSRNMNQSSARPAYRSFTYTESIISYTMLYVTWKFNTKKKK